MNVNCCGTILAFLNMYKLLISINYYCWLVLRICYKNGQWPYTGYYIETLLLDSRYV